MNLFAQKNYTSSTYSYPKISTGIYLEWSGGSIDTEYKWNLDGEDGGKWNGVNVGRVNVEVGEEGQGGGFISEGLYRSLLKQFVMNLCGLFAPPALGVEDGE